MCTTSVQPEFETNLKNFKSLNLSDNDYLKDVDDGGKEKNHLPKPAVTAATFQAVFMPVHL